MSETNCDPRALKVAQALHERERPQATILFGSRARGDYEEGRSDIDIIQVNPGVPDQSYKDRATEWAEGIAQAAYGRRVPVQLVWFSHADFHEHTRYVNHVATRALLDGVVMSPHPENYRSRYAKDGIREADSQEETVYEHVWTDYDNRMLHAELHLDMFETADDLGKHDLILGQHAHSALEHGMKAVIAAYGGTYAATHNLGHIIGTIRRLEDELSDFLLNIPPDIYNEYAGNQEYKEIRREPQLTDQPNYRERTVADAQRLLDRARAIRHSHD